MQGRYKMETVDIKLTELKPYEKNAKKHPPEQVRAVAESIKQYGWAQPIVVDENNEIIIGRGRLKAAKLLKLTTAPCYILKGLTDEQKRKLRLLDNKTNESEWDMEMLKDELADLDFSDFPDIDFGVLSDEEEKEIIEDDNFFDDIEKEETHYGVPYQGNKSRIADIILEVLPSGKRLVDLFGGGGVHYSLRHSQKQVGRVSI